MGVEQVMALFVRVGKRLLDFAINPVPVPSDLGIEQRVSGPFGMLA